MALISNAVENASKRGISDKDGDLRVFLKRGSSDDDDLEVFFKRGSDDDDDLEVFF